MKKSKSELQKDAVPTEGLNVVRSSSQNEVTPVNQQGTNMMLAQSNTATSYTFNECNQIQLGTVFQIGRLAEAGVKNAMAISKNSIDDESAYSKTPTIKAMMQDETPMTPALLDFLSASFGKRWREATIRLRIDQLFVDRMYEDYFSKTGTKEVVFQCLTKFMNENPDKSSVGWLITFMWQNGFRRTVWNVREYYKKLKELEKSFE